MAWLGVLGGDGLTVSRRFAVYSLLYKSSRGYQVDGLPRASHHFQHETDSKIRISEVLNLTRKDVSFGPDCDIVAAKRQKNDACGKGMRCWAPLLPALGGLCPYALLR